MCTIVRYDPQYNIIKVVVGGGELEEGKVSELDFFWFFAYISKYVNTVVGTKKPGAKIFFFNTATAVQLTFQNVAVCPIKR